MKNVVIVTTYWGAVSDEEGERRERELVSNEEFFKPAVDRGARVVRHDNTAESARSILRELCSGPRRTEEPLSIQREIVQEGKTLVNTTAGIEVRETLEKEKEKNVAKKESLRKEMLLLMAEQSALRQREIEELRAAVAELTDTLTKITAECDRLASGYKEHRESVQAIAQTVEHREHEFGELQNTVRLQHGRMAELESKLHEEGVKTEGGNVKAGPTSSVATSLGPAAEPGGPCKTEPPPSRARTTTKPRRAQETASAGRAVGYVAVAVYVRYYFIERCADESS